MKNSTGILALIFLGLLAFSNAIRHPFIHDDVVFILQNPHITQLNHTLEAFAAPAAPQGINTYYRPVLEILYRLEYYLFGPRPEGFHLFNVFVHIINGLLLFGLLQKLAIRRSLAWVIALLFLIHPLQSEAVSCIAGISNLWMALGIFLALHAYLEKWFVVSLVFLGLSFLSKEQAVLFLPLVMVIDLTRGQKNYSSWGLIGLTAVGLGALRQHMTGVSVWQMIMVSPGELLLRLAAIPRVLGVDLRLIFFPYDLHYYRNTDILASNTMAWVVMIVVLGLGGAFYWRRLRMKADLNSEHLIEVRFLMLGLGWFIATLLPVLNIAPLINEYSLIFTPEHFLYLPIVGILILAVFSADRWLGAFKKILLGAVICCCLAITWHQNTFFSGEIPLFERMLVYEPQFGRGHLLLAKAYYFNGLPQKADLHFQQAYTIISGYLQKAANASSRKVYSDYLKEILFDWAQNDCALGLWKNALVKYQKAVIIDGHDPSYYNNMAFVYLHLGDAKNAILSLQEALRIDPGFNQAKMNLKVLTGH